MPEFLGLNPIFPALLGALFAMPVLWAIYHLTGRPQDAPAENPSKNLGAAILLYRNGFLIDANPAGLALLESLNSDPETWTTLAKGLTPCFPNFPATQGSQDRREIRTFSSADPKTRTVVTLEQWEDFARVQLVKDLPNTLGSEAGTMGDTALCAPYPIWISDAEANVTWANEAYLSLVQKPVHEDGIIPHLFSQKFEPDDVQRIQLGNSDGKEELWYDVSTRQSGTSLIHYASDASAIVRAEIAQRNFVQTLTKTFAQLSIGLAIFDRNRQLTLFNPALIDLTNLPADFLSSRPSLLTFFDRLRETRMIPEPKNYSSWRQQIAELVIAAADDRYSETWSLPSGVTYKVNGRPHPDGAIALLFEDISAEVSLTRRFRSQLDLVQAVLDSLDEAVVVFSPVGSATFTNGAYRRYWKTEAEKSLSDYATRDALDAWRSRFEPSDIWDRIESHLADINPHPDLMGVVKTEDGKAKCIRAVYLHGGNKAVVFSDLHSPAPSQSDQGSSAPTSYPACEEEVAV